MKKLTHAIKTILGTAILSTAFFANSTLAATVAVGTVDVGSDAQTVNITGFTNPVVIAGVPSNNDDSPGTVSISNVTAGSFTIKFNEWAYLNGAHGTEKIPYMVVEKGRHVMNDGSVWEAGLQSQDQGVDDFQFSTPFAGTPIVLQSGQSQLENDAYATRAFSVTRHGFGSKMFEQEFNAVHGVETTAFVAIYQPTNAGTTDGGLYYNANTFNIDSAGIPTAYGSVSLHEETSLDGETNHVDEIIAMLEIDGNVFVNDQTIYGGDPISFRFDAQYEPLPTTKTGDNANIALIGTNNLITASYSASYTYSASYPVSGAFDGHIYSSNKINNDAGSPEGAGTWVSTMNAGVPRWIQADFGQLTLISGFSTRVATGFESRSAKDVVLQVSNDGVTFTDHQSMTLTQGTANVALSTPAMARYIRLKVISSHETVFLQIGELEFYGSFIVDNTPPPPPITVVGTTCNDILTNDSSALSGTYHIDPDGTGPIASFDAYCDMTTLGGGWTLVGIREQASFPAPEASSVTDLNLTESVLTADKWVSLRDLSTEIYGQGSTDVWATFNIAQLKASTCVPLKDNLTDSGLVQVEADCTSTGVDYSEIGSPAVAYSTALYDLSSTKIFTAQGGTAWGSGGNWANPPILYLYVR